MKQHRKTPLHITLATALALVAVSGWSALAPMELIPGASPRTPHVSALPDVIPLPDVFRPEGITSGRGSTFYVGSLADGSVYRGDFKTGEGEVLASPSDERVAVGLAYDQRSNLLFVAGGGTGNAYVYDADTGDDVATFHFTEGGEGTFINDVIVTRTGAYFTNSFQSELYRIPLEANGSLPDDGEAETIALSGEYEAVEGFNTNGIEATPNGDHLIIVNSSTGALYLIDAETGEAQEIDLDGDNVQTGDGLLLDGRTLYVVQNRLNQIGVVELAPDHLSGNVLDPITSDAFDVPTTVAGFGNDLYAVNARFGTEVTADTEYSVVRVPKK